MTEFDPKKYHGHIGKGLSNPEKTEFWLNIPKCASNTISGCLLRKQWKSDMSDSNDFKIIHVFVRDPIQRWKAATLEICYHYFLHSKDQTNYDKFYDWFLKKDFRNFEKNLDLHHVKQQDFLYFCNMDSCIFTAIDSDFNQKLKTIFDLKETIDHKNTTKGNAIKESVLPYVEEILSDTDFIAKLKHFYKEDMDLFESIRQI